MIDSENFYEEDGNLQENKLVKLSMLCKELFSFPYLTRFNLSLVSYYLDNKMKDLGQLKGIVSKLAVERYRDLCIF